MNNEQKTIKAMMVYLYEDGRVSHKPDAGKWSKDGRENKCIGSAFVKFDIIATAMSANTSLRKDAENDYTSV